MRENQVSYLSSLENLKKVPTLMVLNLIGNEVCFVQDFNIQVKKLQPKIMLLNPPCIQKVSCFENFQDLAFNIGGSSVSTVSTRNQNSFAS